MKIKSLELNEVEIPKIEIAFIKWTPETAQQALDKFNTINRHCPPGAVARLAEDMTDDAFVICHQGIAFSDKGTLIDGQTRLKAIIESGKPQVILTVNNVPERGHRYDFAAHKLAPTKKGVNIRTQDIVDRMRSRSFADALTLEEQQTGAKPNHKRNSEIASIIRGIIKEFSSKTNVPHTQMRQVYNLYKEDIDTILGIIGKYKNTLKYVKPSPIATAIVIAHKAKPEETKAFAESFYSQIGWKKGDPEKALNGKLASVCESKSKNKASHQFKLTIYAIHKFINKQTWSGLGGTAGKTSTTYFRNHQDDSFQEVKNITHVAENE